LNRQAPPEVIFADISADMGGIIPLHIYKNKVAIYQVRAFFVELPTAKAVNNNPLARYRITNTPHGDTKKSERK